MNSEQVFGGEPQRVGSFRFFLDGQRWERSDAVARMHGYQPGEIAPTTELLLSTNTLRTTRTARGYWTG
ncbi:hypothetical protein OPAG_06962 [Rhodococcus opacus PD630]|nr:hypothetical protein OPAG_06962 [Rhodococcus opacus PD630]